MDTSEEYVKMMEEALGDLRPAIKELEERGGWIPMLYFIETKGDVEMTTFSLHTRNLIDGVRYKIIPLLRQDQLQAMLLEPRNTKFPDFHTYLGVFLIYVALHKFSSPEQYTLGFTMQENYDKGEWNPHLKTWEKKATPEAGKEDGK